MFCGFYSGSFPIRTGIEDPEASNILKLNPQAEAEIQIPNSHTHLHHRYQMASSFLLPKPTGALVPLLFLALHKWLLAFRSP
nr:hypothetical protein Iba_scaffold6744CG0010 [Ipomoea batatas]